MFGLTTTKKYEELYGLMTEASTGYCNKIGKLEIEAIHLKAKIASYEKIYKIRTGYWKDSIGRWRDPKTSLCVKSSVVMTAKLKKEEAAKRAKAAAAYGVVQDGGL